MPADTLSALKIEPEDNVVVVLRSLSEGNRIAYRDEKGAVVGYPALEAIPAYFKAADRDIEEAEDIVKYGEVIGKALCRIRKGECVHIHNVCSPAPAALKGLEDLKDDISGI